MKDSNKISFIIKKYDEYEKYIKENPYIKVKYLLPMINSCVAEISKKNYDFLQNYDFIVEENCDSRVSAQMKSVRKQVMCNDINSTNITGKDVGVAILDTGIIKHLDFEDRILCFKDFIYNRTELYDNNGHGSHVAGIIGGNGACSNGIYRGIAPKCNLIILKVLDHVGNGKVSDVLAGLQWVMDNKEKYNIRVVNISVGAIPKTENEEESSLVRGVNAVWDCGIVVVVVAAGNNGPNPGSVTAPGISRKVITVGASDDDTMVESWGNKLIDYSGRGPTKACILKPKVVAPGSNIISCLNARNGYVAKSGTSMSTPVVTGAVALLLEKYPNMEPKDVKLKLHDTVTDVGLAKNQQGWGMLNVKKLLS